MTGYEVHLLNIQSIQVFDPIKTFRPIYDNLLIDRNVSKYLRDRKDVLIDKFYKRKYLLNKVIKVILTLTAFITVISSLLILTYFLNEVFDLCGLERVLGILIAGISILTWLYTYDRLSEPRYFPTDYFDMQLKYER